MGVGNHQDYVICKETDLVLSPLERNASEERFSLDSSSKWFNVKRKYDRGYGTYLPGAISDVKWLGEYPVC